MILAKGCFWLVLGAALVLATIVALAFLTAFWDKEWCNETLKAGDCELFPNTRDCFCINTVPKNNHSIAVYEHAQSQCAKLNGNLAVPDNDELLMWLSKKMFHSGIYKTIVGLRKVESEWVWMHPSGRQPATDIKWHPDFLGEDYGIYGNHTLAMITVETRTEEQDYDAFTYYNYDYYYEHNRGYQWYGFTKVPDQYDTVGIIFHICHYASEPTHPDSVERLELTTMERKEKGPCTCSSKEIIDLPNIEDSATFTSPGYPNDYCSDKSCRWYISTTEGLAIELDWMGFSLEDNYDFVFVYDGTSPDDEGFSKDALVNSCTATSCADQKSSTNSLEIHFKSDHVTTDLGFKARVTAINKDPCYCSSNSEVEFVNLQDSFTFQSPMHPEPYCKNHGCAWTLSAPLGCGIRLVCNEFQLGQNDHLTIYEGIAQNGSYRGRFSGEHCEMMTSYFEDFHLVFESDNDDSNDFGFSITAMAIKNYCETTIAEGAIGNISFSDIRSDGFIPIDEIMTLECPENMKVTQTVDTITDKWLCETTGWYNNRTQNIGEMSQCVPVCDVVPMSPVEDGSDIRICKVPTLTSPKSVEDGGSITVEIYNCTDHCNLTRHEYATCTDTQWKPNRPTCHSAELAILVTGGSHWWPEGFRRADDNKWIPAYDSMQMCNLASREECRDFDQKSYTRDGQLFITNEQELYYQSFKQLHTGQLVPVTSKDGQVIVHNGDLIDCTTENRCYLLQKPAFEKSEAIELEHTYVGATYVVCRDILYGLGGYWGEKELSVDNVERYVPKENRWQQLPPMNYKRYAIAATQYKGRIFACGGIQKGKDDIEETFLRVCERYDPEQREWTQIADMIDKRGQATMVSLMGKLYLIGGTNGEGDWRSEKDEENLFIDIYDIIEDRWERFKDFQLHQGKRSPSATVVPEIPEL